MAEDASDDAILPFTDKNFTDEFNQTDCGIESISVIEQSYPYTIEEFVILMNVIIFLVGMGGNSLVIYVILRFSKMQSISNIYIFNLALADELFFVVLPFTIINMTLDYWPFGLAMCKIYMTIASINHSTVILLLTVMSADRYVAVCHPISSIPYRSTFIAKVMCLTAWAVSALIMVPIFLFTGCPGNEPIIRCHIHWPDSTHMDGDKAFALYSFTLGFPIPIFPILIFYCLIIRKLRNAGPTNHSTQREKSRKKGTYLVLAIIIVYVFCSTPYWGMKIYKAFVPDWQGPISHMISTFVRCLPYANAAINPILYAFLGDNFKKSCAKAFECVVTTEDQKPNVEDEDEHPERFIQGPASQGAMESHCMSETLDI